MSGREAGAQPVLATSAAEATATAAGPRAPHPVPYAALPGWPGDDPAAALPALLGSCLGLRGWPADRPLGGNGELARLGGRSAAWAESCAEVAALAERLRHPLQPPLPASRPARRLPISVPAAQPVPVQTAEPVPAPAAEPVPARAARPLPARATEPLPARAAEPPRSRAAAARARVAAEAAWQAAEDAERQALVRDLLERRFQPFAAGPGLLTGYYEPELRGAQYPASPFLVPLHGMPLTEPPPGQLPGHPPERTPGPGLPDRTAIEAGALEGQGLELAWVDDPVDAFFLHIQGSGRVRLHDGRLLRLGYAGQNGHPYGGIGRSLIERGLIAREAMSMQAIRAWLATAAPGDAAALLRQNPSYVFFRRLEGLWPDQGRPARWACR